MAIASRNVTVTQGNLNNSHIYLSNNLDLFPEDVFGGHNEAQVAQKTVRIQWSDEVVDTDIDASKNIFRKRGWVGRFFDANRIQAGDRLLLEQMGPYSYRMSKA